MKLTVGTAIFKTEGELDSESMCIGKRPMKDTEHPKLLGISHQRNNKILQLICENGKPEQNKTLNIDNDKCCFE